MLLEMFVGGGIEKKVSNRSLEFINKVIHIYLPIKRM